jgi:hypothetical protein
MELPRGLMIVLGLCSLGIGLDFSALVTSGGAWWIVAIVLGRRHAMRHATGGSHMALVFAVCAAIGRGIAKRTPTHSDGSSWQQTARQR